MSGFAKGKRALAISDRSGQQFPYREMVKEWNNSFVHYSEYERKHPQLEPPTNVADAEALYDPRPDNDKENTPGRVFTNTDTIGSNFDGFSATSSLGSVTITTS